MTKIIKKIIDGLQRIHCSFTKFGQFILLLSVFISIIIFKESIIEIYKWNQSSILASIPLFLFFTWCFWVFKEYRNSILILAGILIAVWVFILQSTYNDTSRLRSIVAANGHNCGVARSTLDSLDSEKKLSAKFSLQTFITQPYFESAKIIIERDLFSPELPSIVFEMEKVNNLFEITRDLNVEATNSFSYENVATALPMYNNQIRESVESIENVLCDN